MSDTSNPFDQILSDFSKRVAGEAVSSPRYGSVSLDQAAPTKESGGFFSDLASEVWQGAKSTGRSVAAKQGSLWATQDFKTLKVDKVTQSNAWT